MNLTRSQFEVAIEKGKKLYLELKAAYPELQLYPVLSRFGPRSGQCKLTTDLSKLCVEFPTMLNEGAPIGRQTAQSILPEFRRLLADAKQGKDVGTELKKIKTALLDPDLKLYNGDVYIEFRCGVLNYESLHRLQTDPRLPSDLNSIGNLRVKAGSLESLSKEGN